MSVQALGVVKIWDFGTSKNTQCKQDRTSKMHVATAFLPWQSRTLPAPKTSARPSSFAIMPQPLGERGKYDTCLRTWAWNHSAVI